MWQQLSSIFHRLVVGPTGKLVDTTVSLLTEPSVMAKRFAGTGGRQTTRAVTYFAAAFSAALVLNAIAFRALGIEAADELPYWVVHVAVILAIGVLAVPLALLTYGACLLLGSFVLAGAAVTLAVSRELGFIPNLKRDAQVYEQFEAAA